MKNKIVLLLALFCALFSVSLFADTAGDQVAGQPVTFTVNHDGTAPFTYQWKKDGANIPGATAATFRIASVQPSNAGTYTVTVANKAGSILSDKAVFTITVSPTTGTITISYL